MDTQHRQHHKSIDIRDCQTVTRFADALTGL